MRFTTERLIPDRPELKPLLVSHMARYRFAKPLVQDAVVLDAGCGCGYGAHYLAMNGAKRVIGIDVAPEAIEYARCRYTAENLAFAMSNVATLAFPSEMLDAVVCLEVFEHVADGERLLAESRRVLRPSGRIIVSTPNKHVFSPGQSEPVNPWHVREYSRDEFVSILASYFEDVQLWGQAFSTPGAPSLTLLHLHIQRSLADRDSWFAKGFEKCYRWVLKASMLPAPAALALMQGDPNMIDKVERFAPKGVMYFIAVGRKLTKHPSPRATNCTDVGSTSMPHRPVPEDAAAPQLGRSHWRHGSGASLPPLATSPPGDRMRTAQPQTSLATSWASSHLTAGWPIQPCLFSPSR